MQQEILRRVNDGWDVVERTTTQVVFVRAVEPPWWRIALEIPLAVITGSTTTDDVRRTLTVTFDDDGVIHRRTTGEVPQSWRRARAWEVPDGPES